MTVNSIFDGVEVSNESDLTVHVDGALSSLETLRTVVTGLVELSFMGHTVVLSSEGTGSVKVTINRIDQGTCKTPIHINLNPMAVCLGDRCVMWP
eukprot:m.59725 g.59725  ORF g.59725 m.59725 type:complete len:95 (-) comp15715_c0_seq2:453-737(-)